MDAKKREIINRVDKDIYYTYHSKKNAEVLPLVLILTAFFFITTIRWSAWIIIWTIYYCYCQKNNDELRHSRRNIEHRETLLRYKQSVLKGECDKYIYEDDIRYKP